MSDRDRSRSPRRDKDRSHRRDRDRKDRDRSRSRSPVDLKRTFGVEEISESDYFLKSAEFRLWLKEEKGKYLDQLLGDDARHYFRKFVKLWNRGKLSKEFYAPITSSSRPSSSQTGYKWAFARNGVKVDSRALESARTAVDSMTNAADPKSVSSLPEASSSRPRLGPAMGPMMMGPARPGPAGGDRTYEREERRERSKDDEKRERKRAREEEKEGRSGGREGRLEKRKEVNAGNRQMRDRSPGGLEADESTLLGSSGNDFAAQIAARDRNAARQEERRRQDAEARRQAVGGRTSAMSERNNSTMEMFKAMAAQKYGSGGN